MPDAAFPVEMVNGVPVLLAPGEIDITNVDGLRMALLNPPRAPGRRRWRPTRPDPSLRHIRAARAGGGDKRAEAGRGEIRLVITGAAVLRIFAITGLDSVIPHFASLGKTISVSGDLRSTESSDGCPIQWYPQQDKHEGAV